MDRRGAPIDGGPYVGRNYVSHPLRNGMLAREYDFWELEPAFAAAGLRRDEIRGLDEQLSAPTA